MISHDAIADSLFTKYGYDCSSPTVASFPKREGIPSCKERRKAGGILHRAAMNDHVLTKVFLYSLSLLERAITAVTT